MNNTRWKRSTTSKMNDELSKAVLKAINTENFPLETKEIGEKLAKLVKGATRTKVFYRLNMMRADGLIKGKFVGPGKGVWVWWRADAFKR